MAVNRNKKEADKTADEQLDEKLRLESELILDLLVYFEQLAEDYRVIYSSTGKIITLDESYIDELNALLKKNYRNVSNSFSGLSQQAIEAHIDLSKYEVNKEKKENLRNRIATSLGAYMLTRANKISPLIADTIERQLHNRTAQFIIDQAKVGKITKPSEVADAVAGDMRTWTEGHVGVISTTEVENIAETSKFIENTNINEMVQLVDSSAGTMKIWITAGDEKVRSSHSVLDGVIIPADDLFTTGLGGKMRFAGDAENGASKADYINCRCSTVYKYDNQTVNVYRDTVFLNPA